MGLAKSVHVFNRPAVNQEHLVVVVDRVIKALQKAMQEKGNGAFVSIGEIRGYLDEEVGEFHEAQHLNKGEDDELVDVAVTAIFGLASMETWPVISAVDVASS